MPVVGMLNTNQGLNHGTMSLAPGLPPNNTSGGNLWMPRHQNGRFANPAKQPVTAKYACLYQGPQGMVDGHVLT